MEGVRTANEPGRTEEVAGLEDLLSPLAELFVPEDRPPLVEPEPLKTPECVPRLPLPRRFGSDDLPLPSIPPKIVSSEELEEEDESPEVSGTPRPPP